MREKTLFFALSVLMVVVLGAGGFYLYHVLTRVEPGPLVEEVLQDALRASYYRYQISAEFEIEGRKQKWSQVVGEKSGNNFHIKGNILGTPVDIYQIGMKTYSCDPVSERWVILEGNDLSGEQMFMAEINPLKNFRFKRIGEPQLVGIEKMGKKKCWVIEFSPQVENDYLEAWWQNFTYRLWIDRKNHQLVQAKVTAENKNSPGSFLSLVITFQDFHKKFEIKPPQ
ncbi:MAG TPA: hypothetical protein DCE07_09335 [Peptococcaceae bacterium]|nr:hypothetical protein [Peptococcaceae bacterium]